MTVAGRFPLYMAQDLWLATGRDALAFESFVKEHGGPLVWSLLLGEIRDGGRCWEPLPYDDFCVLQEAHFGPHYGADDVAAPVDLPRPTATRRKAGT